MPAEMQDWRRSEGNENFAQDEHGDLRCKSRPAPSIVGQSFAEMATGLLKIRPSNPSTADSTGL